MTNLELAKLLVDFLGGKDNVVKAANCMTRLRVEVKDESLVQEADIKKTEGVLGYVADGKAIQIVLGPGKAKKVTDICVEEFGLPRVQEGTADWKENKEAIKSMQKQICLKMY